LMEEIDSASLPPLEVVDYPRQLPGVEMNIPQLREWY